MTSDVAPGGSVLLRNVSWSWIPWIAAYPVLHRLGGGFLGQPRTPCYNVPRLRVLPWCVDLKWCSVLRDFYK